MRGNLLMMLAAATCLVELSSSNQRVRFRNHELCQLPPQSGSCGTAVTVRRWFFNAVTEQCETFRWGNCGVQSNVFRSRNICERHCKTFGPDEESATEKEHVIVTDSPTSTTSPAPMTTTPMTTTTTTTVPATTEVTCGPIDCSQLSCTGSVIPYFDVDTGCPMCICKSDEAEVIDATEETTRDRAEPEIIRCPSLDCPAGDDHSSCVTGRRTVDPETGCETCNCADEVDDDNVEKKFSTEILVASLCEQCDMKCLQAGTVRDESVDCGSTSCQCVVVATEGPDDVTLAALQCPERPVECVCSQDEIATSTIDENGCDTCTCAAVELEIQNEVTQLPPSVLPSDCPDVEDCTLTCDDDQVGARFATDENGCRLCACQSLEKEMPDVVEEEAESFAVAADDIAADEEAIREVDDRCAHAEQCTSSCPFGNVIDKQTGCETCECRNDRLTDEDDEDEDAVIKFAPSPPLCQPEVGCDVDRCVRATDPQTRCDLCICDDDTGIAEAVEEYNRLSAAAEAERVDVTSDTEDGVEPEEETGSTTTSETGESETEVIATGSDDHVCDNQYACDENCFPVLDNRGCIVDCSCADSSQDVTSLPVTEAGGCAMYRCSCDEESGFTTRFDVDADGCSVCSCVAISTTASPPSSDIDDWDSSPREVEEETIEAVSWERLGTNEVVEKRPDTGVVNEQLADARRVWCSLSPEHGPCAARLTRWYYDFSSGSCVTFRYGGCRGNVNNFVSEQACRRYCKPEVNVEKTEKRKWYKKILGLSSQ